MTRASTSDLCSGRKHLSMGCVARGKCSHESILRRLNRGLQSSPVGQPPVSPPCCGFLHLQSLPRCPTNRYIMLVSTGGCLLLLADGTLILELCPSEGRCCSSQVYYLRETLPYEGSGCHAHAPNSEKEAQPHCIAAHRHRHDDVHEN